MGYEQHYQKGIISCLLIIVLVALSGYYMYSSELADCQEKELKVSRYKVSSVAMLLEHAEKTRSDAVDFFDSHEQKNLQFMELYLKDYVTEDGYDGPRVFEDGAVVELQGDQVSWPEGMSIDIPDVTADQIRQGDQVKSGSLYLEFRRIDGDTWYVDWTDEQEIRQDRDAFLDDGDMLSSAEKSYGGSFLLVSLQDDQLTLLCPSEAYPDALERHVPDSRRVQLGKEGFHFHVHLSVFQGGMIQGPDKAIVLHPRGLQRRSHRGGQHMPGRQPVQRVQVHPRDAFRIRLHAVYGA